MAIDEHGGSNGIREQNMFDSAMATPQNKFAYADCDLVDLAAAYAFGLAKNHPFVDGNKRTAAISCFVFLELNGVSGAVPEAEVVAMFEDLAAGEVDEEGLAVWLRERLAH